MSTEFEQIIGKKSHPLSLDDLRAKAAEYQYVHIDLGTGDGLFAWRLAKQSPDTFVIGIDAARESLREGSARAAKKPARGGAPNAVFLCMNVLEMPEGLEAFADVVYINFPWGSLLQAVARPFEENLHQFAALVKDDGILEQHINLHVFNDAEQRHNLGLPELDDAFLVDTLFPIYEKCGLKVKSHHFTPSGQKVDVASTWGGRLTRRSGRPTLSFTADKIS